MIPPAPTKGVVVATPRAPGIDEPVLGLVRTAVKVLPSEYTRSEPMKEGILGESSALLKLVPLVRENAKTAPPVLPATKAGVSAKPIAVPVVTRSGPPLAQLPEKVYS